MYQYSSPSIQRFPASAIQDHFWMIHQLQPESSAYNIPFLFRMKGRLNDVALDKAFNEIIFRHSVFRTTFTSEDEVLYQRIATARKITPQRMDLTGLTGEQQQIKAQQIIDKDTAVFFDLAKGPLLRITLIRLADEEQLLLIVMHHIITDQETDKLFFAELSKLYDIFDGGQSPPLAAPKLQYSDYALWQQKWLKGDEYKKMISHWQKRLKGKQGYLNLPADQPRPVVQKLSGAANSMVFPVDLTEDLKTFSQERDVNIFLTLLAAYLTLLYRYTNQENIILGVPLTNRRREAHKEILGSFVNTMPLSFDISGDTSFNEILRQVRLEVLTAHGNQEVPFEKIVRQLKPKRDVSYHPLFQAGFAFDPPIELQLRNLTVESRKIHNQGARMDIFVKLWENQKEIHGCIEYNTDLFEAATIARFAGHYETLLKSLIAKSDQSISSLPILPINERQTLLTEWNSTETALPKNPTLNKLFERQVEKSPGAVALVYEKEILTYRELNKKANQVAHHLRSLGVGPEVLVGVFMERSPEMVIALYGILKAGGAYVPFDPDYPKERLAFMMEDTQVPIMLTQKHLQIKLPESNVRVICMDSNRENISKESPNNLISKTRSDNLAYIIYTSGSTGRPKGVMNCHEGICNRLLWMQEEYHLTGADCVIQKTPFSFDVSVWEFFWPLFFGARLVVAPPESHKDPSHLIDLINIHNVTTIHFVPSMLRMFLENKHANQCHCLQRVICSGEALPYDLQQLFFSKFNCELHNLYGPTEAAVDVTYWACDRNSCRAVVPIGRPVANTQIYILDKEQQPLPVGIPGELHIGGLQVARGYLNRGELTDDKFIADPFKNDTKSRLYKTGDIARYLPGGEIEYLGRMDFQVKIRGLRMELGEIEAVLCMHPQISGAVVLAGDDNSGEQRLIAYVVPAQSPKPSIESLRGGLLKKLPEYMVPALFIFIEEMPLSTNGKIDRKALPEPSLARPEMDQAYAPPSTSLEKNMVEIWRQVLSIEKIGIHDNFFTLGGSSLLVVQAVALVNEKLNRNLPVVKMFQYQTINELAKHLMEDKNARPSNGTVNDRTKRRRTSLYRRKQLARR